MCASTITFDFRRRARTAGAEEKKRDVLDAVLVASAAASTAGEDSYGNRFARTCTQAVVVSAAVAGENVSLRRWWPLPYDRLFVYRFFLCASNSGESSSYNNVTYAHSTAMRDLQRPVRSRPLGSEHKILRYACARTHTRTRMISSRSAEPDWGGLSGL